MKWHPNRKSKQGLFEKYGHTVRQHTQGIIVDEVVMVALNSNKFKFLGHFDWYYFKWSKKLSEAIKSGNLIAFAEECAKKTTITKHWDYEQRGELYKKYWDNQNEVIDFLYYGCTKEHS